jgi:hypothetical protein
MLLNWMLFVLGDIFFIILSIIGLNVTILDVVDAECRIFYHAECHKAKKLDCVSFLPCVVSFIIMLCVVIMNVILVE